MAYPIGLLSIVLEDIDRTAAAFKAYLQARISQSAAGNISASTAIDVYIRSAQIHSQLTEAASTPGLAAYAQSQKNSESIDVVAEFVAMQTAIAAIKSWIAAALPKQGDYLLLQTLGANGPIDRQFTPAETSGLRTVMQAAMDTIG